MANTRRTTPLLIAALRQIADTRVLPSRLLEGHSFRVGTCLFETFALRRIRHPKLQSPIPEAVLRSALAGMA
jgi:hypothetical protein